MAHWKLSNWTHKTHLNWSNPILNEISDLPLDSDKLVICWQLQDLLLHVTRVDLSSNLFNLNYVDKLTHKHWVSSMYITSTRSIDCCNTTTSSGCGSADYNHQGLKYQYFHTGCQVTNLQCCLRNRISLQILSHTDIGNYFWDTYCNIMHHNCSISYKIFVKTTFTETKIGAPGSWNLTIMDIF